MKTSSLEVTKLLDKLYNLRGSDSVVFKEMESAVEEAEATKMRTTEEKGELQDKIAGLELESKNLNEQGRNLIDVLSGINKKDYEIVIDRLNINFDPEQLTNKLNDLLPKTIDKVNSDIKVSQEELVKVEEEMNSAITTIEEIGIRKDAAIEAQEKLNEYFELALSGNINITREGVTSLLEQFGFSEEETREAAKILMFPEDALYDYDAKIKDSEKKSISEVMKEAKNQDEASSQVVVDKKIEETSSEEVKVEVVQEEKARETKFDREDLMDLFTEIGLDYLDYTDLSLDIFTDNISLLYDKELEAKVDRLLRIGKTALDIYLNPTILTKYDYRSLDKAILLLQNSGLDPKKVPLMAY